MIWVKIAKIAINIWKHMGIFQHISDYFQAHLI